jgi:hypothetical protein
MFDSQGEKFSEVVGVLGYIVLLHQGVDFPEESYGIAAKLRKFFIGEIYIVEVT